MLIYEVHVEHGAAVAQTFDTYMRQQHLPEILATGCFVRITFERTSETHARTRYHAESQATLDRYLAEHTTAFRADFQAHFPEGMQVRREVWEAVETFENRGSAGPN